jgi:hypothetical protein
VNYANVILIGVIVASLVLIVLALIGYIVALVLTYVENMTFQKN